jgi:hypothetical protein
MGLHTQLWYYNIERLFVPLFPGNNTLKYEIRLVAHKRNRFKFEIQISKLNEVI